MIDSPPTDKSASELQRQKLEELLCEQLAVATPTSFPLSFSQQRLWILEQLGTGGAAYHIALQIRLTGPLDRDVVLKAAGELVRRHESLRTVIRTTDLEPRQLIEAAKPPEVPLTDLTDYSSYERESQTQAVLEREARRPFDLVHGPLFRLHQVRLADDSNVLIVVLHHIIADGWSIGILVRDFSIIYDSIRSRKSEPLPDLSIQFGDFATWQRDRMSGATLQNLLDYWIPYLQDVPPLELPRARVAPTISPHVGGRETLMMSPGMAPRAREFVRKERATIFMLLLAVYEVLLSRYSHQDDFAIGVPIAGRLQRETEGVVGFFANTIAMRAELSGNPHFRTVLNRVRQSWLHTLQHQEMPFERLVEALNPTRSADVHPLFQTVFTLENAPWPTLKKGDLSLEVLPIDTGVAKFDLSFSVLEQGDSYLLTAEYRRSRLERSLVCQMLRHFETLLTLAIEGATSSVSQLPLLDCEERQQLTYELNPARQPAPVWTISSLFQRQLLSCPSATAIISSGHLVSYRELHVSAMRLTVRLRAAGVGAGDRIGIRMRRSIEQIVGLLAIVYCGAAYVPIERNLPASRVEFLINDAKPSLILTDDSTWSPSTTVPVLCVPEFSRADNLEGEFTDAEELACADSVPDSCACLLYTSGSTGVPKGVEVLHQGIIRLVHQADYVSLDRQSRVACLAPLEFDASTFEIWGPLLNGGCCVLLPDGIPDPAELQRAIQVYEVNTLWLTSALFNRLIDDAPNALDGVRYLLTGGDVLSVVHIQRAQQLFGADVQLINGYGPTECTTFACTYSIPNPWPTEHLSIPIGRPISNTQVYLLDGHGELVPRGVVGEMWLGGLGVARGYLNRPDLTFERFHIDRFSDDAGSRLYKTGDLARWLPDGQLEFVGRVDQQVKIRGHRIEPGEIESCLTALPGISQAAVIAHTYSNNDRHLVAFVVLNETRQWTAADLRRELAARLPEWMVPTEIMVVASLPLTHQGKLNRAALPSFLPATIVRPVDSGRSASTELERLLVRLWCELLELSDVGVDQSFFELGGHSLLAIGLFMRIEQEIKVRIPPESLFQYSTIAQLARFIAMNSSVDDDPQLVVIREGRELPPLFVMASASGHTFLWQFLLDVIHPDQPLIGVCATRDANGLPIYDTMPEVADRMAASLCRRQPDGPLQLIGYSAGGHLAHEVAVALEQRGRTVGFLGIIDTYPMGFRWKWSDRPMQVGRFLRNAWLWLCDNDHRQSFKSFVYRITPSRWRSRWKAIHGTSAWILKTAVKQSFISMLMRHQPRPLSAQLTLFRAQCQSPWNFRPDDLGWGEICNLVKILVFSGCDHRQILRDPHVLEVGRAIRRELDLASTESIRKNETDKLEQEIPLEPI